MTLGWEIHTELHHGGSAVLAVNLSWRALRGDGADPPTTGLPIDADITAAACRDALALARELARHLGVDSSLDLRAAIVTAEPAPLTPIVTDYGGFRSIPDHARTPRRIQPVTALIHPADDNDALGISAQDLLTDLVSQFGITAHL